MEAIEGSGIVARMNDFARALSYFRAALEIAMRSYIIAGLGILLTLGAGCAGKHAGAVSAETIYPTVEEAALGALEFNGPQFYGDISNMIDRQATLQLLKTEANKREVYLDGDGTAEVLILNGSYVAKDGTQGSISGASNGSWAVLQKVATGWRVVGAGYGAPCPPDVIHDMTNGWNDLISGYHMGYYGGSIYLYQFDGTRYKLVKETKEVHEEKEPELGIFSP